MEQKQNLLSVGDLLNQNGDLNEAGYATTLVKKYDRNAIKAAKSRIKEWDYYYVGNQQYGIALTIADNSYMSLVSASFMDFEYGTKVTDSEIKLFSNGRLALPSTSQSGDLSYKSKRVEMSFLNDGKDRKLLCKFDKWGKNKSLFKCELSLTDAPSESMVIATPFKKPKHFYYNQKINCMKARGNFCIDGLVKQFEGNGTLDWGRGVWTYKNTWYWGSLSSEIDGHKFGFNIGYGFGDTSNATENMLFFDGKAHKLNNVTFNIPKGQNGEDDYLSEWTFSSDDQRFEMRFQPILDRSDKMSLLVLSTDQHQVFGRFFGKAVLDDGTAVALNGQIGFAEKVFNKW